jgi:tetratricopeptide (TPR) repeat protein
LVDAEFYHVERQFDEAYQTIAELLDLLYRSGARYFLPEALRLKSDILFSRGYADEARAALLEARRVAAEISFRPHLWQILAALARMVDQEGEADQAKAYREEAKLIVQYILDHISDPGLQHSFLTFVHQGGIVIE